jgi:hypothetical protein
MTFRNLPAAKRGVSGDQMWGLDPHSLNLETLSSGVEIFISNFLSCHVAAFLISL